MANLITEVGSPENVGMSSERLLRIDNALQRYVDQEKLSGIVALIAREEQAVYFERFGQMSRETGMPMQSDTIFRIASMTKPVTSVAAMTLWEEGRFQLDDPVSRYIPELGSMKVLQDGNGAVNNLVEPERQMTVRDLLRHTSGLSLGISLLEASPVNKIYQDADLHNANQTLEEMTLKLSQLPLAGHPGAEWRYSIATDVLARLVEVISGMPFDEYLSHSIFDPLSMNDTGFHVPQEKFERFATVYGLTPSGELSPIGLPSEKRYTQRPGFLSGGDGLVSTAPDYLKFCQMMLNGGVLDDARILGRRTVDLMTINHLQPESMPFQISRTMSGFTKGYGFGLGFAVMTDLAESTAMGSEGEYNWGGAATTFFWVDPQEHLIGILMTQFMPMYHYNIDREFRILAYQALVD